jgi:hypothetical protein
LRALDALGIRLNTSAADNSGRTAKPSVDIDAIVTSARKDK